MIGVVSSFSLNLYTYEYASICYEHQWRIQRGSHKEPSHLDSHCLQMYMHVRIYLMSEVTWLYHKGLRFAPSDSFTDPENSVGGGGGSFFLFFSVISIFHRGQYVRTFQAKASRGSVTYFQHLWFQSGAYGPPAPMSVVRNGSPNAIPWYLRYHFDFFRALCERTVNLFWWDCADAPAFAVPLYAISKPRGASVQPFSFCNWHVMAIRHVQVK